MNALTTMDESRNDLPVLGIREYFSIVRRRRRYFLVPFALAMLVAVAVVIVLPPRYQSVATILVESQQIPDELVRSTITAYADEQVEFIRQKVLTRSNVLDVIQKYGLYPGESRKDASALVDRFRDEDLAVELIDAAIAEKGRRPTISLTIGFTAASPTLAQQVCNELVTLFLNENARSRTERAAETTSFLADEGEKIRGDIQGLEEKLTAFKSQNREVLPEVMGMNMGLMERTERDYQNASMNLEGLIGQLRIAEMAVDQYNATVGTHSADGDQPSVATLQARYEALLVDQTEKHPDVIRTKQMLDDARARAARADAARRRGAPDPNVPLDPTYAALTRQVESIRGQVAYLQKTKDELAGRLKSLEQRIANAPEVEREYTALQRDLTNLTTKYEDMKDKELGARISQNLEEERKGERFTLLEPPLVPTDAVEPNPVRLMAIGLGAAIALGLATVAVVELLDQGLRGAALHRAIGMAPLVTIPIIASGRQVRRRKTRSFAGVAASATVIVCLVWSVHMYWLPLDVAWYQLVNRVSSMHPWTS